jgi:hypothetical protein
MSETMKKNRIRELIILCIIFATFNMLVFVIPFQKNAVFWIVYAFTILAIAAQSAIFLFAFDKATTLKSKFLGFPIFRLGYWYLFIQLFSCFKYMTLATFINVSVWIVVVQCVLLLAVTAVGILMVDISREKMSSIAIKQEDNTIFMRTLHVDIKALSNRVSEEPIKLKLFELSERVKYSDIISSDALSEVESEIKAAFDEMKTNVRKGQNNIENLIDELDKLLSERNDKCKIAKSSQGV